jgi:hypothetical protein
MPEFWQTVCWATFWAILSQTHLVTLKPIQMKASLFNSNVFALACSSGVAQWSSNPHKQQKTRVRIPPRYKVFREIIIMLTMHCLCVEKINKDIDHKNNYKKKLWVRFLAWCKAMCFTKRNKRQCPSQKRKKNSRWRTAFCMVQGCVFNTHRYIKRLLTKIFFFNQVGVLRSARAGRRRSGCRPARRCRGRP